MALITSPPPAPDAEAPAALALGGSIAYAATGSPSEQRVKLDQPADESSTVLMYGSQDEGPLTP
jgi:hypothetical protein